MSFPHRKILGIRFLTGTLQGHLEQVAKGGLVVVPSAPVLVGLDRNEAHRVALENADFAITDSAFLVMLWQAFKGEALKRISGLRLFRALMERSEFRDAGATFWIMPSDADARANRAWLREKGVQVREEDMYVAPMYPAGHLADPVLLARIEARAPKYIVICLGGGVQERLGWYLRRRLSAFGGGESVNGAPARRPAILCTGAAIAFLSGRQVNIPVWADRLFLGWFFRIASNPRQYFPRYWASLRLVPLVWRHGEESVAPGDGLVEVETA